MEKSNRFNREIQQISPKILCIKTENRTKGSGRMNDFEKSEDDTNSENDQSLFSNFFFNKSLYGNFNKSQQQYEVHSNDSKNSFERANNKNLSIKFLSTIRPSNSIENFAIKEDKNLKKKINSKIIIPFYEIDELDKKSNCSFHSTKGKSASSNNNQIRYSIDRNFKFEYDILKDSSSSNYHPKFWTNEEIQKQYGGKFKINSGYSSSNGSMNLGLNKPEEDMKIYSN